MMNHPSVSRLREARAARRRERLERAITEAKHAILRAAAAQVPDDQLEQVAIDEARSLKTVGMSPILIAVIIELVKILVQWFLSNRDGFLSEVDTLARDVVYNANDCITVGDLQTRGQQLEQQLTGQTGQDPAGQDPLAINRLQKLIAIVAIIKVMQQFIAWWTK